MSYFDNIVFDENTLLEGKQAEEYLERKLKEKKANEDKYNRTHGNSPGFDGRRTANIKSGGFDAPDRTYDKTARNNPRFDAAREIENHREKYNDVMPKQTSSEKALNKARDAEKKSREYASKMIKNKSTEYYKKSLDDEAKGNKEEAHKKYKKSVLLRDYPNENINAQLAHDAARRHYRRTHKEAVEMLEAYNPELIEL